MGSMFGRAYFLRFALFPLRLPFLLCDTAKCAAQCAIIIVYERSHKCDREAHFRFLSSPHCAFGHCVLHSIRHWFRVFFSFRLFFILFAPIFVSFCWFLNLFVAAFRFKPERIRIVYFGIENISENSNRHWSTCILSDFGIWFEVMTVRTSRRRSIAHEKCSTISIWPFLCIECCGTDYRPTALATE